MRKIYFGLEFRREEVSIPPVPHSPGIGLKRHTLNIKHYLHKSYLHKKFILAYIRIMKLLKKNYFVKFIEELDFIELSTQAKLLREWNLHDNRLNDRSRYCFMFLHFEVAKV